MAEKVAKPL